MKSQIIISIMLSVIFLSSCKKEQIATDNYRLEVETLVSNVTNGSETIYNSDKVFYYDQTGRLTGTGDHTVISEHYAYIGTDSLVYYGLNDTTVYLLNADGFPVLKFHSGNGGTQTDYHQDTTWYTYDGYKLIHQEMHELFSGVGITSHILTETFYKYDSGDNLISDSTFNLISGTLVSKSYFTYLQDDDHSDTKYFNQIGKYPYTGKMAGFLLDNKITIQMFDWGSVETSSHFTYSMNDNGLPSQKTVNTTITESGSLITIEAANYTYSWEEVADDF